MLSTNIGLNRLGFSESPKCRIMAVAYLKVDDFTEISCFDLFGPFLEQSPSESRLEIVWEPCSSRRGSWPLGKRLQKRVLELFWRNLGAFLELFGGILGAVLGTVLGAGFGNVLADRWEVFWSSIWTALSNWPRRQRSGSKERFRDASREEWQPR